MEYTTIAVTVEGAVATIALDRPAKLNALSTVLRSELTDALKVLSTGDLVRAVRIRGNGRGFTAGYDLDPDNGYLSEGGNGQHLDPRPEWRESSLSADLTSMRQVADWVLAIRRFRKPLIVQAHGFCLSGGLDIAGAADSVFVASDTKIGHPAARGLGLPATLGLLPFRIGMLRTKQLLFTGDLIDGRTAAEWGLANEAVDADELDDYVSCYCARVALMPLDILMVHKAATNRWFDIMGLTAAVDSTMDLASTSHQTGFYTRFLDIAAGQGLKSALAWRDDPYREK